MEKIKIKLQGHEKFPLREGWLTKGLNLVSKGKGENVFLEKNATDNLGIGNNMVKSLRYWMKAFNLINEKQGTNLTELGELIFNNDLYFEDYVTLWVLHSQIAKILMKQQLGTCSLIDAMQMN